MRRMFVLIIVMLILATMFSACNNQPDTILAPTFDNALVNYGGSDEFYLGALNSDKLSVDSVQHLPIYKFESLAELNQFKTTFANDFSFEQTHGEFKSFEMVVNEIDEDFFNMYSLLLIYVPCNSSSLRYEVEKTVVSNGADVCIYIQQTKNPEEVTNDMAGWFVFCTFFGLQEGGYASYDAKMME